MNTATSPYTITNEMIDHIVTAALEGGINYWAISARPTHWPEAESTLFPGDKDVFASEVLTKGADLIITIEDEDDEGDGTYTLTLAKMKKGIRKAAELRGKTPEAFYEDHDAGDADLAVQFALFGELVYG